MAEIQHSCGFRPFSKTQHITCIGFFVEFQPHKGDGLIGKAPSLDKPQGFGELGECRPQKKCAVLCRNVSDGKRTQFISPHCGVVVFRCAGQPLLCVLPRGIGVDYAVFLFNGFSYLLSSVLPASPPLWQSRQRSRYALCLSLLYGVPPASRSGRILLRKISTLPLTRH